MDILATVSISVAPAAQVNAFRFGKFDSAGVPSQCIVGDEVDGVIQFTTDAPGVTLMYDGILQVAAAGALSAGTEVVPDANGRAIAAAGAIAVGRLVNGTSASAQDDLVEIEFFPRAPRFSKPGVLSADGAVLIRPSARYAVTKGSAAALTLAAPTDVTDDGLEITITSNTAFAHTLTATGLFDSGTASVNLATFAAQKGAGLKLMAYNARWKVISSVGITFS